MGEPVIIYQEKKIMGLNSSYCISAWFDKVRCTICKNGEAQEIAKSGVEVDVRHYQLDAA